MQRGSSCSTGLFGGSSSSSNGSGDCSMFDGWNRRKTIIVQHLQARERAQVSRQTVKLANTTSVGGSGFVGVVVLDVVVEYARRRKGDYSPASDSRAQDPIMATIRATTNRELAKEQTLVAPEWIL